jgi:hypothetical protein
MGRNYSSPSFLQTETDYKIMQEDLLKANNEYEIVFEKVMDLEEKMK